jgi:Tol biopolymer transport system component
VTKERWEHVKELFYAANELPPEALAAFLADETGDDASLRRDVESMLAMDADDASVLDGFSFRPPALSIDALMSGGSVQPAARPVLNAGHRIGSYEIVELLGAGAMGEVYRTRDTKLNREVALKVIPPSLAMNPDRLARFRREAQLLAALNHPNIAAIYGVEGAADPPALVLELIEGPTLAARIADGTLPFAEALRIARQIAEGLEAAHEQDIIHRDLKPSNIHVRADGLVKILDFGLAKSLAVEPVMTAEEGAPAAHQPRATGEGMILGTAGYMSPEQARGQAVDKRGDIWAFGCVLFEMLAGRPAFDGETMTDVLAAVVTAEPEWSALPADLPLGVRTLLRRCLKKDSRSRLQAIGDARIELDEITSAGERIGRANQVGAKERRAWLAAAVALVSAILYFTGNAPTAPEMRVEVNVPSTAALFGTFAISPDGRQIVFAGLGDAGPRMWLRSLATATAEPLPGTEGARLPFWSPDGRSVAFFTRSNLLRIDIGGGLPQKLAETGGGQGGTWSADGVILFAPSNGSPLFRAPPSGDKPVALTSLDPPRQTSHRFPSFLPNGRQFLFYVTGTEAGIYLGSLDSQKTKRLTTADTMGAYLTPDWLLFVHQGSLVARHLDLSQAVLSGNPATVAEDVTAFSVSTAGSVAYRGARKDRRQLTWFDRSGKTLGTVGVSDETGILDPELSPDGRQVAAQRTVQGNTDVWLLDETRTTRFTFNEAVDMVPVWSPDGSRIVFRTNRNGAFDLYEKPSSGNGEEKLLLESPENKVAEDWWSNFLVYYTVDPVTAADVWIHQMDGGDPFVFLETAAEENHAEFSPDGRWLAYQANETGQNQIFVRPFQRAGGQWQVSTSGGTAPRWRSDGKELYYIGLDGTLMAVATPVSGASFVPGPPVGLFKPPIVRTTTRPQYDVASDGRFLINVYTEDRTSFPITLLLNWKPKSDE